MPPSKALHSSSIVKQALMLNAQESQIKSDRLLSSACTNENLRSNYSVYISVYRFRAIAGSIAMVCVIIGAIIPFANTGVRVDSFQSTDMDADQLKQLLDHYNTISGALTASLMKPIDGFIGMLVAVTFLCAKYQHKYVITAAITALGYLINTGITSLNMQVVPGVIHPRIFASDLTVRNDYNDSQALSVDGFLTTTWNPSFRERESGNSILNTIMRNLLVMTEEVPIWCNKSDDYSYPFKQVAASYGFPARTWQQYALSTALEPSALVTLPMNAATSELPTDIELPMNKSIATNLAAYALLVSNSFLGWWGEDDVAWGHNWYLFYKNRTDSFAMADHLNLTEHFSGETSFLANVHDVIVDYYSKATNASTTDNLAKLEFSRVDLSETVVFDALTIEIPTQIIGKQAGNSSDFYKSLNAVLCNHDACLMNDLGEFTGDAASTTVYPRVQALAICFNQAGGEDLVVDFNYWRANEVFQACEQRSNTSMIIVSVGKRLEGDVFESRPENTSSGIPIAGQVKNARMVYSLTVGRLSWTLEDLSGVYSAECLVEGGCYGIQFPLENAGNTSTADVLVSSARGTPLNLLSPINLNELFFQPSVSISQWKVLVSTVEETRGAELVAETRPAVIVLPRNFKTIDTSFRVYMDDEGSAFCELFIDKHITHVEKNHLYIEHTLQPAYTAGLFFIFQNGVVQQRIWLNNSTTQVSLGFSGNIQDMYIQASIPTTNLLLAVVGCAMVLLCSIIIAKLAKRGEVSVLGQESASTAAEAMGNQDKFPPLFLRVQLRDNVTRGLPEPLLDSLRVKNMVLVNTVDETEQFVIGENDFNFIGLHTPKAQPL